MQFTPGPWSDPPPVSPVTVAPITSGRGPAQPSPLGVVVDVVGPCVVVVVACNVVAAAVVVLTVDVVGDAHTDTPSRWHRFKIARRHATFMFAKTPHVAEHCAVNTAQADVHSARLAVPARARHASRPHASMISSPHRIPSTSSSSLGSGSARHKDANAVAGAGPSAS
jgi:hypothetical protein